MVAFGAGTASCRQNEIQSCTKLIDAKQYEAAAKRCSVAYAAEGDARAGAAAAQAHYYLGDQDGVLAWVDRLAKAGRLRPGVWSLAAAVHQQRGEVEQAEQEYRRDLLLIRATGNHQRTADVLYSLFRLSWGRSGFRKTFLLATEALQEAAKTRDPDRQTRAAQALYTILFEVGDLEGARRALEVANELEGQDREERASLLNNLGTVLAAEGRLALARRNFEQALQLAPGSTDEFLRGVHLNLTEAHLDLGEVDRAARHLAEAMEHADPRQPRSISSLYYSARIDFDHGKLGEAAEALATALGEDPPPEWAWDLEYRRGLLEEARGDLRAAEAAYRRSIGIVEEMRRSLAFDELKAWLLDRKRQPYEALFLLQVRLKRAEDALATAERAQARTFLDAFVQASSSTKSSAGKQRPSDLSLDRMEGWESLMPAMTESPVAALQPIGHVLSAFGDRHGLVYFEAGDYLWLITVSHRRVRLHALVASATVVRHLCERFLANPGDSQIADRLGEILLPPGSLPEEGKTVHVVADSMLGNLPFAALRRERHYLVQDHAVVIIPSLSALAALETLRPEPTALSLVLADPHGDLPSASAEGVEVAKLLGSAVQSGGNATSTQLGTATHARVLHLASHTGLGPRGPWLQLSDRRVTASEIVAARIGPRLVVLASCSSGVRKTRQMWGSLSAAFLAAGSRAVLGSLWSIEDERSRDFVRRFYRERGAFDPSGALARAQRVAIGEGLSPTFWGPFVLFGSDLPLDEAH